MSVGPISSSAPVFYYIDINSETDPKKEGILEVQIQTLSHLYFFKSQVEVSSPQDTICAVVSVQPYSCPIFEGFGGLSYMTNVTFQTMLRSSAFFIRKQNYPSGFFLVLKVLQERDCIYGGQQMEGTPYQDQAEVEFLLKTFK